MVTVTNFPTKPPKPPVAKTDDRDGTITNLRIEHVTYPLWDEGKFMGQPCQATNVMFEHGGKQKSSRFHHHLSQHEAHGAVVNSLRRKK